MSNKKRYFFKKNFKSALSLKKGEIWRIAGYREISAQVNHLAKSGLVKNAKLFVVQVAPSGSPIAVSVNGCKICLRTADLNRYVLERCYE